MGCSNIESIIHNNASSSEKVIWSESREKSAQLKHRLQAFVFSSHYLWIIVMFLSAVWTLILTAPIHCRASIDEQVMQCYISPNLFIFILHKRTLNIFLWWCNQNCAVWCPILQTKLALLEKNKKAFKQGYRMYLKTIKMYNNNNLSSGGKNEKIVVSKTWWWICKYTFIWLVQTKDIFLQVTKTAYISKVLSLKNKTY